MSQSQLQEAATAQPRLVSRDLHYEISQFLYLEARLLDEHRYEEWYELLADDVHYWMPTRYNRFVRDADAEFAAPGEMAHFDDDKDTLHRRVIRLGTGRAWAEAPPSRTRHIVANVSASHTDVDNEVDVYSAFLIYRNRGHDEVDIWAGGRTDILRRLGPMDWQIARRKITLDQSTILSKNLSVFF